VLPGEMSDTNCHLEAGVFNNHADAADFEEEPGNCSLGGSSAFYKGKIIFDPNLIKLSVPCTGLHFFPVST
jgi:hypothetical protein